MFFDTTYQVVDLQVHADEDQPNPHLVYQFVTAVVVPTPQGPQILPVGSIKIPVGKDLAVTTAERAIALAAELPDPEPPSKLQVVGNMGEAENVAAQADAAESLRSDAA